jgi:hypothetical protein
MNLEIKKGEWEGSKKAKEEIGAKAEKDKTYIWTVLEKIQLSVPIILGIFFLFWLSDKYHFFLWIAQQFKDMTK